MKVSDKIALIIIVVVAIVIKITIFPSEFWTRGTKINIANIPKIGQDYKYNQLKAPEHEMDEYDNKDQNIIGKIIMVNNSYNDWNITYSVLDKNNRTVDIDEDGKVLILFSRFKYADYDMINKKEIISSQNNNDISFINFTFDNGDYFAFSSRILNNSKFSNGCVETWQGTSKTRIKIHKTIEGYSLETDYAFIGDLLACNDLKIYIKYKNCREETKDINLTDFKEYIVDEKSYLK